MGVTFDPSIGIIADDSATVRQKHQQVWRNAFNRDGLPSLDVSSESPAGQVIDGEAYVEIQKDNQIIYLANMFNPKVAEGRWQDALAKLYMLDRHTAEPTVVTCQVTGRVGTVIPHGAVVADTNGVQLISTGAVTIGADGTGTLIVRCAQTGATVIAANSVTQIISNVPGWDTVDNAEAGVMGRDEESRIDFEVRRVESVANNGHGTTGAIYSAIANLPGVLACTVLENTGCDPITKNGVQIDGHSVYIAVYGGEDADIAETIYNKKDCGCGTTGNTQLSYQPVEEDTAAIYYYNITRPTPVSLGFKVTIRQTLNTPGDYEELIKEAIVNNLNGVTPSGNYGRVKMASTLYASRFYDAVVDAGIQDLVSIEMRYPETSSDYVTVIDVPADEIPITEEDYVDVVLMEED